jgi:phage nucleotide-binding protein
VKFDTVSDTLNRGVAIIIYSNPGVGKTTLAATLPAEETLFINIEGGIGPLMGTKHVVFNLPAAIQGFEIEGVVDDLYKYLRTEKHGFKYVVIDNMSELEQQLILNLTMRRGKDTPELREYGDVGFKMKEWVRLFRDLVYQGITVVFNAWEIPLEIKNVDGAIVTQTFPMIGKKLAPQACGIVDVVGHLEVYEKTGKRWVRFGPSDQYITKSQFKGLDNGEPADMPTILEKLYDYNYGTVEEATEKAVEVLKEKGDTKK